VLHVYNSLVLVGVTPLKTHASCMHFQIQVVVDAAIVAITGIHKLVIEAGCIGRMDGRCDRALVLAGGSIVSCQVVWVGRHDAKVL